MNCKLYNDDCLNILPTIEDESIDLIITSPPYNMKHRDNDHDEIVVTYNTYQDELNQEEYEDWQTQVLNECYRILKPNGLLYYNHKERHSKGEYFHPLNIIQRTKFHPLQTIIWNKNSGVMFNTGRFSNCHEIIIVAYKTQNYMRITIEAEKYFDVWNINRDINPCLTASFPLELPKRIIHAYEKYNNLIVMDCFMGSGTTAQASLEEGRDFIGIEIDKDYYDYAVNRTRTYQTKLI